MKAPVSPREGPIGSVDDDAEAQRWARETVPARKPRRSRRPSSARPSLSPLADPPQNVELIRKPRKEKPVVEEDAEEA